MIKRDEIYQIAAKLAGDETDDAIFILTDMVIESVKNYCNLKRLPDELVYVVANVSAELYKDMRNSTTGRMRSVSEDGRNVTFSESGAEARARIENRIGNMKEISRFRRLYRMS
ncbi:MAG: phage head-tail connector protein [Clostridiales bacterium]|jgi:hypothetical protein|nr:phage head-tail connector protein [Clostridiales bacterium]